jgi:hypothetical protein
LILPSFTLLSDGRLQLLLRLLGERKDVDEAIKTALGRASVDVLRAEVRPFGGQAGYRVWHFRCFRLPSAADVIPGWPFDVPATLDKSQNAISVGDYGVAADGVRHILGSATPLDAARLAALHLKLGHAYEGLLKPGPARWHLEQSLHFQGFPSWRAVGKLPVTDLSLYTLSRLAEVLMQDYAAEGVQVAKHRSQVTKERYGPTSIMRVGAAIDFTRALSQELVPELVAGAAADAQELATRSVIADDEVDMSHIRMLLATSILQLERPRTDALGHTKSALELALSARLTLAPDHPMVKRTHIELAKYYYRTGDTRSGRQEMGAALEISTARGLPVDIALAQRSAFEHQDFRQLVQIPSYPTLREWELPAAIVQAIDAEVTFGTLGGIVMPPWQVLAKRYEVDTDWGRRVVPLSVALNRQINHNEIHNDTGEGDWMGAKQKQGDNRQREPQATLVSVREVLARFEDELLGAVHAESGEDAGTKKAAALKAVSGLSEIQQRIQLLAAEELWPETSSVGMLAKAVTQKQSTVDPLVELLRFKSEVRVPAKADIAKLQEHLNRWAGHRFGNDEDMVNFKNTLNYVCKSFSPPHAVALILPDGSLSPGGMLDTYQIRSDPRRYRVRQSNKSSSSEGATDRIPKLQVVEAERDKREKK